MNRLCSPLPGPPRDVASLVAAWQGPLALLHSGRAPGRWARWSVLGRPAGEFVFDGRSCEWRELESCSGAEDHVAGGDRLPAPDFPVGADPLDCLDRLLAAAQLPGPAPADAPPFVGGFIGVLAYELGAHLEPATCSAAGPPHASPWPPLHLLWCPQAIVIDHAAEAWWSVGGIAPPRDAAPRSRPIDIGAARTSLAAEAYVDAATRARDYVLDGDVFQVNLTRQTSMSFDGDPRGFAAAALAQSGAWYGAHIEFPGRDGAPDRVITSMSPELFLDVDASSGSVVTRPIKGTRPAACDPGELAASSKDTAELHMIVDLMRNDLGRVCRLGSVEVVDGRRIESHPTVHHGVAEVRGELRDGSTMGDLLRATFPPGSVTGAPKIRAMQIIADLEPVPRGPYCGAIGAFDRFGRTTLNVAIRTAALTGRLDPATGDFHGTLDYGTGGAIVAESEPRAELREAIDKAAVLDLVLAQLRRSVPDHPRAASASSAAAQCT